MRYLPGSPQGGYPLRGDGGVTFCTPQKVTKKGAKGGDPFGIPRALRRGAVILGSGVLRYAERNIILADKSTGCRPARQYDILSF